MIRMLALLALPGMGLLVSGLMIFFAWPLCLPLLLAAAALGARFLLRDTSRFANRYARARMLCLFCAAAAIPVQEAPALLLAGIGLLSVLTAGVIHLATLVKENRGFRRLALETAGLALLLGFTFAGYCAFRGAFGMFTRPSNSCAVSPHCTLINRGIDLPYDIFTDGGGFIVTAYKGIHFIDAQRRQTYRPEFGYAVFSSFNPARRELVGGGKGGTYTAFIFDTRARKFLFKKEIKKSDVIDVAYFKGKYYLLCESGNFVILDARTHAMKTVRYLLLGAYSIRINGRTGKIYISSWLSGRLLKIDARTLEIESRAYLWTPLYKIDINERDNTVLVAQPFRSRVAVLDGNPLKPRRAVSAGFGVIDIQYSPEARRVFSANVFDGTFTESDSRTGKILKTRYIGNRARGVYHDPRTRKTYAVSKCGVFEVK